MVSMKRIIKIILALVFILILLLGGFIVYLFIQANSTPKELQLVGLKGGVTIRRDEYNVPHINAEASDLDAFYALGYVHAQDRLWQMEFQRRVAAGTLSEIFGAKTIRQDEYLRTWGFYRAAQQAWVSLDARTKEIVHAYTMGVNAYLQTGVLPVQFYLLRFKPKPWTDIDSIAWQKMMAWSLDTSWQRKIKNYLIARKTGTAAISKIFPPYPASGPIILSDRDLAATSFASRKAIAAPRAEFNEQGVDQALRKHLAMNTLVRNELGFQDREGKGSNAWVISGKMTESGKPILANDVHLQLTSPALWYLAELKGPGLHVTGGTIAGLPLVAIGHNEYIAWGVTHSYTDTQDLYIEKQGAPLRLRQETINIRGAQAETIVVRESRHGPVISDVSDAGKIGPLVAIKWPALQDGDTTVSSFVRLNYARNWNEFVAALKYYVTPPQNFLYADTRGNIGYYLPGKIPLRSGWVGTFPISADRKAEWQGYIPFQLLPHSYNPPEGYIAAANNKITSDHYPYSLTFRWNVPPYRSARINDVIRSGKASVNSMAALQADTSSYIWRDLRSTLLKTAPLDASSAKALAILGQWNGRFDVDSEGASVFAYWYQELLQSATIVDGKPAEFDPLFVVQNLQKNICYSSFTTRDNCAEYLGQSLRRAAGGLASEHGADWRWGSVHHAVFQELAIGKVKALGWLWNRSQASPGGDFTVNVGTYDPDTKDQTNGAVYRQIIDLSDFNRSLYVIPLGEQDNPFSLSYNDQLALWLSGKYIGMSFE